MSITMPGLIEVGQRREATFSQVMSQFSHMWRCLRSNRLKPIPVRIDCGKADFGAEVEGDVVSPLRDGRSVGK
jgi:hypothetical protein